MRNIRSVLMTGAAVAAAAVGGAAFADAATSTGSSGTTPTGSASTASKPAGVPSGAPANFPAHGTASHEDAEKPVTGAAAAKAKAAAIKYLGGGTAGDVTTDFSGRGYEVDVTKSGKKTEVHLDSSFNVRRGPDGERRGAPGGPRPSGSGGPSGPPVSG